MIKINTYLKDSEGECVYFQNFHGKFRDLNYIEGAIDLEVNGVSLIDLSMWDYIDQLWAYICQGIGSIKVGKAFSTYFPDQPIRLSFKPLRNDMLQVLVNFPHEKSVVVNQSEFIKAMSQEAIQFFNVLTKITPECGQEYLALISDLNGAKQVGS